MQLSNIQDNLSKTELVQRLQQIMQDAARAAQATHTLAGDERSRAAEEQVADSREADQDPIRDETRREGQRQGRPKRCQVDREADGSETSSAGRISRDRSHIIDFTA